MKTVVIYDSGYGNTAKVAQSIGRGIGDPDQTLVVSISDIKPDHLSGLDLLVVGSPTQRFNPTPAIKAWLRSLQKGQLSGLKGAAFDTRFTEEEIAKVKILAFFVSIFGYAAKPIARKLRQKGAQVSIDPEGFYVSDMEGPLIEGELERAEQWGKQLKESSSSPMA